jgi:hypothetical protein
MMVVHKCTGAILERKCNMYRLLALRPCHTSEPTQCMLRQVVYLLCWAKQIVSGYVWDNLCGKFERFWYPLKGKWRFLETLFNKINFLNKTAAADISTYAIMWALLHQRLVEFCRQSVSMAWPEEEYKSLHLHIASVFKKLLYRRTL